MFTLQRLPATIEVAGRTLPLIATRHPRARTIRLRPCPLTASIRLTLPPRGGTAQALALLRSHQNWLAAQVAGWPAPLPFRPGAILPFDGSSLTLHHDPSAPLRPQLERHSLIIGGPEAGLADRTHRWLKARAREALTTETHRLAAEVGRPVSAVTLSDPRARWGSCNARTARIAYSWRLILAPPWVRSAVVAHEVAHLLHPHHGPAFWREVATLNPDAARSKAWLRQHGRALHMVGATAWGRLR
jgi:predicted metal-dependent hydrolase